MKLLRRWSEWERPSAFFYMSLNSKEDTQDVTQSVTRGFAREKGQLGLYLALVCSLSFAVLEGLALIYILANSSNRPLLETSTILKTPVPQFQTEIRSFTDDARFHHLTTPEQVETAWASFIRPHAGFITINNPERYDLLPNNVIAGTQNSYMISFYHQLHCLQELQMQHVHLLNRTSTHSVLHDAEPLTRTAQHDKFAWSHAEHCFNYIRQGIQCAGDMTLEGPDQVRVPGESPLRGWGVRHQCRDWRQIQEWVAENEAW